MRYFATLIATLTSSLLLVAGSSSMAAPASDTKTVLERKSDRTLVKRNQAAKALKAKLDKSNAVKAAPSSSAK